MSRPNNLLEPIIEEIINTKPTNLTNPNNQVKMSSVEQTTQLTPTVGVSDTLEHPNQEQTNQVSQEPPKPTMTIDEVPPLPVPQVVGDSLDMLYIVRDKVYPIVQTNTALQSGIQLDADVYRYQSNGSINPEPIIKNRNRYVTNDSFASVEDINKYMRLWGKMPAFMEIRKSPGKGYGVFTLADIPKNTFLGFYQGNYRPTDGNIINSIYIYSSPGFDPQKIMCAIDAECYTFANWTRFMNDGDPINVIYSPYNYQVYAFSSVDIPAGSELIAPYGDAYWANREKTAGVKKLP